jgi:hypothetical protein
MVRGALLGLALLLTTPALAAPRVTAEYQTGGRTPLGYYGVAVDVQPVRWFSISGGLGLMNFQGSSQLQGAIAPRLRWPVLPWLSLDAGAAFSRGRRSDYVLLPADQAPIGSNSVTRTWKPGHRLGPEVGVELAPLPRGRLRLFGGLAFPLDEASCWFQPAAPSAPFSGGCGGPMVPALARDSQGAQLYLGLAAGWSVLEPAGNHLLPPGRWYGWQSLLLDAGAAALLVASGPSADSRRTPFRYAAEKQVPLVFLAGGPIVHLTHRRPLAAAGSLLLRGGLVAAAFALGLKWDRSECIRFDCKSSTYMTGGAVVAAAVDAAWLAWER